VEAGSFFVLSKPLTLLLVQTERRQHILSSWQALELLARMDDVGEDGWRPNAHYWGAMNRLLRRNGPLSTRLQTENADATQLFLREGCRVLIIGAGGLGCELLKNIALSGFRDIHVIDLDTIDITNLNRQFLFRSADVGKPKAAVAAAFINARVPGVRVTPHHANIMDFSKEFYSGFNFVIAGLDSIDARRWLNALLVDLVDTIDGVPDPSTIVPLIDGGTEGFQGQARVIIPRMSSCFECTLSLFPPARNFPLCTIANTPRLPEHCIEYANVVLWPRKNPFGPDVKLDADNPSHISWLFESAKLRAEEFGIRGVTYRLTQGVVKNIVPAVASTNAIIAAACANEAVKMATDIASNMDNYIMYNGTMGVYTYTYQNEKRPDCPVCGRPVPRTLRLKGESTLAEFVDTISSDPDIRSRQPFLRTEGGRTLYASAPPSLQKATSPNLEKLLSELISPEDNRVQLTDRDLQFGRTLILELI
jgi:NEDD8-activating enzyme E1